jgi:phosphatidylinositol kinase/protein kinase (PI-3  family)
MGVLRENKESLLAVLEAFVYDPLINWRLMQAEDTRRPEGGGHDHNFNRSIVILTNSQLSARNRVKQRL